MPAAVTLKPIVCPPQRAPSARPRWHRVPPHVLGINKNRRTALQRTAASSEVLSAMQQLAESGKVNKWGSSADGTFTRRSVALPELKMVGVKAPDQIAIPSTRNDMAFLASVVGASSVLALAASTLPGAPSCAPARTTLRTPSTSSKLRSAHSRVITRAWAPDSQPAFTPADTRTCV